MRKWTRDRAKRRPRATEKPAEAAAAPLQPAYFEQQESQPKHEQTAPEVQATEPEPVEIQEPGPSSEQESGDKPKRRRRRGRGGRGRTRKAAPGAEGQAVEAPPVAEPVAVPVATSPSTEIEPAAPAATGSHPAAHRAPKGV